MWEKNIFGILLERTLPGVVKFSDTNTFPDQGYGVYIMNLRLGQDPLYSLFARNPCPNSKNNFFGLLAMVNMWEFGRTPSRESFSSLLFQFSVILKYGLMAKVYSIFGISLDGIHLHLTVGLFSLYMNVGKRLKTKIDYFFPI